VSGRGGALLAAAVLLVAINLRGPVVAVSPVVGEVQADLGMDAATAGLLTSLPVLCFAVVSPAASWLLGRLGVERGVTVGLLVIAAGILARSAGGAALALAGTVLIGAGITVGNVAVPVVIGRDFPRRSGAMLGAYVGVMNTGSMLTLSLTVPIADLTGWRVALAAWVGLVVVGLGAWWLAARRRPGTVPGEGDAAGASGPDAPAVDTADWWRRPVVWALTAAFAGQAFAYYGLTAWLPEVLADLRGQGPTAAGASSSLFQVAAVAGALLVPLVRARADSLRVAFLLVAATWLTLPLGLLLVPAGWPAWCLLGGAAQGGGFTVIFSAVLARARDLTENRRMSALVQGGGYAVAATGPSVVGALHDATTGWTVPLLAVLASLGVLTATGAVATRHIRGASAGSPASAGA
jgi:CP family cyanate transporter-like MFS transporter